MDSNNLPVCSRCGQEMMVHSMSFFNTDDCCMACIRIERQHPDYVRAKSIEEAELLRGNSNFGGVGLPKDYATFVAGLKND